MDHRVCVGLRVVRGPDWKWGDQNGGEGYVGTVVELDVARRAAVVQWDCAERCLYRCGHDNKYDLRVFDRGPAGLRHYNAVCSWCDEEPSGILWKCAQCYGYVLCSQCYGAGKHSMEHRFDRCDGLDQKMRTRVKARHYSRRLSAQGTFCEAVVRRGVDWQWGNQDGGAGNTGKVTKVEGWERQSSRSVVEVVWSGSVSKNIYRNGHTGKVDLKCISPTCGGHYYPDHLELLGAVYIPPDVAELSAGDAVRVELDPDLFKITQEEHGGWSDLMAEYIGRVGVVNTVQDSGDIIVRYSNNKIFLINQFALTKVDTPVFGYGDVVRISDDMVRVHSLQPGHGEWNDDMALSLGQIGRIIKVQNNSDVRVAVNGKRWVMNPRCMVPAPNQTPLEDNLDEIDIDRGTKLHILSLFEADIPDVVGTAAAAGDSATLNRYLSKYPHEVNTQLEGKGPVHLIIVEGFMSALKTIIKFRPDLEMEDESGEKPLHICAYVNNGIAAKLLIDAGANVNARDANGTTPLSLAAALGHCSVVNALLESRDTDIKCQDSEGKTPLHSAIVSQQWRSTRILLQAGADATLLNHSLFTPLHNTAGFGFLAGLEKILRFHPELVNQPKDDGYAPLHIAAANNYADLVSLIASHPRCDINARTKTRLTALHIAVHEGHVKVVERLVGFGANLNITTSDGNTALHLALGRNTMTTPTEESPKIKAIQDEVEVVHGKNVVSPNVIVGMFLVSQGADIHIKNYKGVSPLQTRPTDVSQLMAQCRGHGEPYHGSLKTAYKPFDEQPRAVQHRPVRHVRSAPVMGAGSGYPSAAGNIDVNQSLPGRMEGLAIRNRKEPQHMRENMNDGSIDIVSKSVKLFENLENNQKFVSLGQQPVANSKLSECKLCCEKPADIQVQPCKHVVYCHPCRESVKGIKRCLECRSLVSGFVTVCVLCQQEKPVTARFPCQHRYCSDCNAALDHCSACRIFAEQQDLAE